ncbi:MAG: sigma-70 family RNA polymerase sigma factor [Lentimicrobium sp.]|nr:sigma-70 family RNA polymerase sigma factor [Lentimicrobium sp.]
MDESQLLKDCLNGNVHAQKRLYENYSRKMFGVCLRYAPDHCMAEDLLQEGFIRVFTRLDTFRSQGSLEGWIRRIMVTTSLEMLRKKDVLRFSVELDNAVLLNDETDDIPEPADPDAVLKLIKEMPDGFRTVFNLYAIEDYKHSEIGQLLGISEGTSKSQYTRARAWLLKRLTERK